jgi:hypothetical protein
MEREEVQKRVDLQTGATIITMIPVSLELYKKKEEEEERVKNDIAKCWSGFLLLSCAIVVFILCLGVIVSLFGLIYLIDYLSKILVK